MTTEIEDLRLIWPASLFLEEAQALINAGYANETDPVGWLFEEAFASPHGGNLVREFSEGFMPYRGSWHPPQPLAEAEPWGSTWSGQSKISRSRMLLDEVSRRVRRGEINPHTEKQYWSARQQPSRSELLLGMPQVRERFLAILEGLNQNGYFDGSIGSSCADSDDDPLSEGVRHLKQMLKRDAVWPLSQGGPEWISGLGDDEFFDLVEVFFDLVQRPRNRYWHEYCDEWHFSEFDHRAGQRVYIWRVNSLLGSSSLGLELSGESEDRGLLVRTVTDDRSELVIRAIAQAQDPDEATRIAHAASVWRSRKSTRESKRESARTLGDVLENRRKKIQQRKLLSKPHESDLFHIINKFDIRHMEEAQKGDYGEEFLDYFFWLFLATIELLDGLTDRPTPTPMP